MNNNIFFSSHVEVVLICVFHFLPLVYWLLLNAYNTNYINTKYSNTM